MEELFLKYLDELVEKSFEIVIQEFLNKLLKFSLEKFLVFSLSEKTFEELKSHNVGHNESTTIQNYGLLETS